MRRKIFAAFILAAFATVVLGQACSEVGGVNESAFERSSRALSVSPITATLQAGGQLQLNATGGERPYTFTVISGNGTVSQSGLYTAPTTVSGFNQTAIVSVRGINPDDLTVYTTITLQASDLSAFFTPTSPRPNTPVVIGVNGGNPPYHFQIISGAGTLNNNTYQAPSFAETAQIEVIDALNLRATVIIPIQ